MVSIINLRCYKSFREYAKQRKFNLDTKPLACSFKIRHVIIAAKLHHKARETARLQRYLQHSFMFCLQAVNTFFV